MRLAPAIVAVAALCTAVPVHAQALRCSTFLHNRDGSWTSFWDGVVPGRYGPVPIHTGERFAAEGRGPRPMSPASSTTSASLSDGAVVLAGIDPHVCATVVKA